MDLASRTLAGFMVGTVALAAALVVPAACGSAGRAPSADDAGAADDASAEPAFTYRGDGCLYDVSPPSAHAFVDLALDAATSPGREPVRVRLGLGGGTTAGAPGYADPSRSAVVTWETLAPSRAARLRIGASPGSLARTVGGYSWTTPAPAVGFGSDEPATSMHEVHVCALEPGRTYYYEVGGGTPEVWSATQSFTTVPVSGAIQVGILGDARDRVDVWQRVQQRMRDRAVSLQVTTGDLVFAGTQQSLYDRWLGAIWKDAADPSRFVTLGQQMMVMVAGNHENEAARYYGAFALPGAGEQAETFASFEVGNAHVVVLDDQSLALSGDSAPAKALRGWLETDLAQADRNRETTPFVVVVHHRGLYTTSNHAEDYDVLDLRRILAPIYDANHVDLVVNGHDHAFERTKPLRAGPDARGAPRIVAPGAGTVYVVNAGAGADAYAVADATFLEKAATFGPGTSFDGLYGVLTLEGRTLTLTSYGLTVSGTDPVIDSFDLVR